VYFSVDEVTTRRAVGVTDPGVERTGTRDEENEYVSPSCLSAVSLQRPDLTRRNALKAAGAAGLGLFGLSSIAAADDVYTRVGGGSTPPLTVDTRLDADAFYTFTDEMADAYGRFGVFGMSVPLDAEFVGAWTDGFVRRFDSNAFDGSFRANAAVVSYRLDPDEFAHLAWVAGRVDDARYNPDPFGMVHSPMRLCYLDTGVDLESGSVESISFPHRDGGGRTLTLGSYTLRYPPAETAGGEVRTSETTNPMLQGVRTETGLDGAAQVTWEGYGPTRFAIAGAFTTATPLSELDVEWNWGYGIGTEGPI
jgi:hypothetical protein